MTRSESVSPSGETKTGSSLERNSRNSSDSMVAPGFGARLQALYGAAAVCEMRSRDENADKGVDVGREASEGEAPHLLGAGRDGMAAQEGVNHSAFDLGSRMRIDETPDAAIGESVHA